MEKPPQPATLVKENKQKWSTRKDIWYNRCHWSILVAGGEQKDKKWGTGNQSKEGTSLRGSITGTKDQRQTLGSFCQLQADCLLFDIAYFFAQNKLAAQATYVASPTNLYIRVRAEDNVTAIELEGHVTSA
jgi:hypothetical protein